MKQDQPSSRPSEIKQNISEFSQQTQANQPPATKMTRSVTLANLQVPNSEKRKTGGSFIAHMSSPKNSIVQSTMKTIAEKPNPGDFDSGTKLEAVLVKSPLVTKTPAVAKKRDSS